MGRGLRKDKRKGGGREMQKGRRVGENIQIQSQSQRQNLIDIQFHFQFQIKIHPFQIQTQNTLFHLLQ